MKISTFGFLTRRGVRNLGKHWAMTIACIASLSVCMTLNIFASLIEVNVDSMVSYLGSQNEMVVYVDPEADDATIQSVGNALSGTAGVSRVQYMSKEDVLNQYKGYMSDYAALLNEFENDNPFKANYRVSLSDLSQMETISKQFENISGVYSVTAPIEMTRTFVEVQQAVTKVGRGLVLVLMAVSIITVGTTIRLSVFARRREIEIMKYVGATNALVTLPFVIEGLTMGLLSGILTAAATIGGYAYIVQLSPTLGGLWQMLMGTALAWGAAAAGLIESNGMLENVFVGTILTATSVSITVETLKEMGKLETKVGNTILAAALIDDVLGLVALTLVSSLAGGGESIVWVLVKIAGFFVFAVVVGYGANRLFCWMLKRQGGWATHRNSVLAFVLCLVMAYCAEEFFGVADITGAYAAGLAVACTPKGTYIQSKYNPDRESVV